MQTEDGLELDAPEAISGLLSAGTTILHALPSSVYMCWLVLSQLETSRAILEEGILTEKNAPTRLVCGKPVEYFADWLKRFSSVFIYVFVHACTLVCVCVFMWK